MTKLLKTLVIAAMFTGLSITDLRAEEAPQEFPALAEWLSEGREEHEMPYLYERCYGLNGFLASTQKDETKSKSMADDGMFSYIEKAASIRKQDLPQGNEATVLALTEGLKYVYSYAAKFVELRENDGPEWFASEILTCSNYGPVVELQTPN